MSVEEDIIDGFGAVSKGVGLGENEPGNPDNAYSYEDLGRFKDQILKSEERVYLQSGYTRKLKPRALEFLLQEPDITIVIKKRQFSSLAENYRLDRLDSKTRIYLKAVKRLFYNKCRAIANYERLTKLDKIYQYSNGEFSDVLLPALFAFNDMVSSFGNAWKGSSPFGGTRYLSSLDTLKKVRNLSDPQYYTTWSTQELPYVASTGEGTGTFELTLATSINTNVSTQFGGGSASISLENPFELMTISQEDIEQAISDVVGFTSQNFFSYVKGQLKDTINKLLINLNDLRMSRGASQIVIQVSPLSTQYKKVRAFIDEEGREISISYSPGLFGIGSDSEFDDSSSQGKNGLTEKESSILNQIVSSYYSLLDNESLTRNEIRIFNEENDYVRRKMRLEFEDRCIIQQQDLVHIFVGSKTTSDANISAGFNFSYSKDNFLNQIENQVNSIEQLMTDVGSLLIDDKASFLYTEKNAIAGPDFPLWMWMMMRNEFTRKAAGTHVFAGIVTSADQEYASGKHTVSVSCKDFTGFLEKGRFNINPSLDVIDSSVYDPLTPFKTDYDPATGILQGATPQILDENQALINTEIINYKTGPNKGKPVTSENYSTGNFEILNPDSKKSKIRKQFFDPDGFVYRWKEGIGTLILDGPPHLFGTGSLRKETSVVLTNSPYKGQDVMNVLSLLITGQPYNFNTFLKAALNSGFLSANKDQGIAYSSSNNFLKGLISDIKKNNSIWGDFVPFKKINLNDAAYQDMLRGQYESSINTAKLNELLRQKAEKIDQLGTFYGNIAVNPQVFNVGANNTASGGNSEVSEPVRTIGGSIYDIDIEIKNLQDQYQKSLPEKNLISEGKVKIFGDDVSIAGVDYSTATTAKQLKNKEDFRKKLFKLTQRYLWKVKANDDKNFFIVDDTYDKNFDLQLFEDGISNLGPIFQSTYTSVADQVRQVSSILGLELFADSQGHINARAPGYNKIPSSVLYEMVKTRKTKGIKLFPEFLESLFFNQTKGLTDKLETLEDQLRLRAAILGALDDSSAAKLFSGSSSISGGSKNFSWVTVEGSITEDGIKAALLSNNPDFSEDSRQSALKAFNGKLSTAASTNVVFDIVKKNEILSTFKPQLGVSEGDAQRNQVDKILKRLKSRLITDPIEKDIANYLGGNTSRSSALDIISQTSAMISERQNVIRLLTNAVKNLEQGSKVNKVGSTTVKAAFEDFFAISDDEAGLNSTKIKNFPEILIHMIEDENVDDLGPGSGSRYIIKDSHLIRFSIKESPPDFTVVQVNGSLSNNLTPDLKGFEVGERGSTVTSAIAADYDMWRMYGFSKTESVSAPYLTDPESQCAPLAVFLLNQARKKIFTATVEVKGNEYIQAGEVYYLESRDLLLYAESVQHSFSWGSGFTTTINGTYVRKPGEFIPTMLDVIGKSLYTRRNQSDLFYNIRNSNPDTDVPITVLKAEQSSSTEEDAEEPEDTGTIYETFSEYNRSAISSLILSTSGLLTPSKYGSAVKIELRIYYPANGQVNSDLKAFADKAVELVKNPEKFIKTESGTTSVPDVDTPQLIPDESINVVTIELGSQEKDEPRSPSHQAWELARALAAYQSGSNTNKKAYSDSLKENLFKSVIDIWAVQEPNEEPVAETSNSSTPENQDAKEKDAFVASIQAEYNKQKA